MHALLDLSILRLRVKNENDSWLQIQLPVLRAKLKAKGQSKKGG